MNPKPLIVVGSINIDLVATADRFAAPGETIHGRSFHTFAGGKGANQAAASAALGYPTVLLGRVGEDAFASVVLKALEDAGVDVTHVTVTAGSTGTASITTVDGGQNSIVVVPGANGKLSSADVEAWWPIIQEAGMVLAQLEIPMEAVEMLGERCASNGIPFMLDPAPVQALGLRLLSAVSWLTPNESEVLGLAGIEISKAEEPELRVVAEKLLGSGCSGVVLKLGRRGAYVAKRDLHQWIEPFLVDTVDATAAGDVFNGAFAASLLRSDDVLAAGRIASAAAALSTTRQGAIPSMPAMTDIQALMAKAGERKTNR